MHTTCIHTACIHAHCMHARHTCSARHICILHEMYGRIDGQTGRTGRTGRTGWTDRTDGRTDDRTDGLLTGRRTDERIVDGRTAGSRTEQLDGRMDARAAGGRTKRLDGLDGRRTESTDSARARKHHVAIWSISYYLQKGLGVQMHVRANARARTNREDKRRERWEGGRRGAVDSQRCIASQSFAES